ncbi:hypothetical protein YTPLAS18_15250 [Nitrospira sp.]|nr:hypothetical protein YTPLAS18_15250 [Nitrospira sp.]
MPIDKDRSFSTSIGRTHTGKAGQPPNLTCGIALSALLGMTISGATAVRAAETQGGGEIGAARSVQLRDQQQLLAGDRVVVGTVIAVRGQQIEVRYPDSLQPRYLPLDRARERGMEFKPGDAVRMVFNDQQVLVDFHPLGTAKGEHHILTGKVAEQMKVGQERVVIERDDDGSATYAVRPLMRSKVAALPVSVPAVFLLDEANQVIDVTFGDMKALEQVKHQYKQMSNPKAPHTRIDGTLVSGISDGRITVKTREGDKQTFEVRPFAAKELSRLSTGDQVTLLIDTENQVLDVATLKGHTR